jgi:hypothetical protein
MTKFTIFIFFKFIVQWLKVHSHCCASISRNFSFPKLYTLLPITPMTCFLATTILLSDSEFHYKYLTEVESRFHYWLISLSIMFSKWSLCYQCRNFLSFSNNIPLCVCTTVIIQWQIIWFAFSFWLLWIMLLWMSVYMYLSTCLQFF